MSAFWLKHLVYPVYELTSGRRILSKLAQLEESQWWSPDMINDWQQTRLAQLLHLAYNTVPYYRQVFDARGIVPGDVRTVGDLRSLPLLTKSMIQRNQQELVSTAYPPGKRNACNTGGSTGKPMRFYQNQQQRDFGLASKLRSNRWAGWESGKLTLKLWGHPGDLKAAREMQGRLRSFALREHTVDAFGFSTRDMADLVNYIRRAGPYVIEAYASMLTHFAAYLSEQGITDFPSPDGIITSTDMLFAHQRALIERVFRAEVFDRYGSREASVIATECEKHTGMHINAEQLIVEFTDESGWPVPPGQLGHVVITDLYNFAMPFIRYDIEDVAVLGSEQCSCGRGLPLMKELVGRIADILRSPEGQFVSASALTTVLYKIPGLRQTQLVQKATDRLQVNVVRDPDYDEVSEATFRQDLVKYFGSQMKISFNYVDEIPRTASGKTRLSVVEIEGQT